MTAYDLLRLPTTATMSTTPRRIRLLQLPTYQSSTSIPRLKTLYSDFARHKHSNPSSYSSNVDWWRRSLEAVVLKGWQTPSATETSCSDRLILHANGPALAEVFRYEGVGKPLGLAAVIAELAESKAYYPLSQFLTSAQSIYDPGWLPYRIASFVVGKPLWWALQQLSVVESDHAGGRGGDAERWNKVKGDYVVVSLLEQAADGALRKQQVKTGISLADSLYNFESFKKEFAGDCIEGVTLSDTDMKVLLKYLERDRKAVIVEQEAIKFATPSDVSEITAVDIGVLELKLAVTNLEASVQKIQGEIDEQSEKTAAALKQKRKEVAMSHLRARKRLDDLLKKRLGSLDILHSTLLRVEASAGDVQIMKSYESSTATLRSILAHPLLQREKIDETMDAMASANADAQEIDDTIRIGAEITQGEAGIDEAELEEELNKLVQEEEAEKTKAEEKAAEDLRLKLASMELSTPSKALETSATPERPEDRVKQAM
ncbi:hypothetical protein NM688_g4178 [Phlebia brevispora]|uniref:Uncharacterized protein n=1 Tax=Phlebia brevispora TaxID=194682 RepID=A0ACC1T3W0_9APHY|nr:hypothetical protein NM688_g4178 [Phlebia brevispora]